MGGERRWRLSRDEAVRTFRLETMPHAVFVLESTGRFPDATSRTTLVEAKAFAGLAAASSPLYLAPEHPEESRRLVHLFSMVTRRLPGFAVTPGRDLLLEPARALRRLLAGL